MRTLFVTSLLLALSALAGAGPYRDRASPARAETRLRLRLPRAHFDRFRSDLLHRLGATGVGYLGLRPSVLTRLKLANRYTVTLKGDDRSVSRATRETLQVLEQLQTTPPPTRFPRLTIGRVVVTGLAPVVGSFAGLAAAGGEANVAGMLGALAGASLGSYVSWFLNND